MHQAGGKSGRPKNKYTAEALESIKQDLTRFQVQKDNGIQQVIILQVFTYLYNIQLQAPTIHRARMRWLQL